MKEIYQIKKVHPEVYQIMEAGLDAMYVICEEKSGSADGCPERELAIWRHVFAG